MKHFKSWPLGKSWVYSDEKADIVSVFMEIMIQCSGFQTSMAPETPRRLNKTQIASEFLIPQGWGKAWVFALLISS